MDDMLIDLIDLIDIDDNLIIMLIVDLMMHVDAFIMIMIIIIIIYLFFILIFLLSIYLYMMYLIIIEYFQIEDVKSFNSFMKVNVNIQLFFQYIN